MKRYFIFFFLIFFLISCKQKIYPDALSPEESLKKFTIDDNFEIQLYASEPYIKDPVCLAFDEHGIAYAVEMPDYPYPPQPGKEAGKIVVLLDKNGDNKIDTSIVFADKLSEATSILPWNGGLIVTAAPNILYLKDTTGDFKADIKQVLFSGFYKGNSEAQITGLKYSIDNWIYAANYGEDSKIKPDEEKYTDSSSWLSLSGTDFRFRLDKNAFEAVAGTAQFGQSFDDWNHRFITSNSHHIMQSAIAWKYLHRNPDIPTIDAVSNITDHDQNVFQISASPYWRIERTKERNEKYKSQGLDRVEYERDHFTGAAGGVIYSGDLFPSGYYGNYFVAEVADNLVHRDVLSVSDTSSLLVASRGKEEEKKEFLASTDMWFRPTNVTYGPDGALYITDMYRQHIENPYSVSDELKKDMNYDNGKDMGRIYRIVPKGSKIGLGKPLITKNTKIADLVNLLAYPNQFWAMEAQKKLVLLHDKSAIPLLISMFNTNSNPMARLHALFTLDGLNATNISIIQKAISDAHPGVREAGILLGEKIKECHHIILDRLNDSSTSVAMQAVLSAGGFKDVDLYPYFKKFLSTHSNDKWFRIAVLTSLSGSSASFFQFLIKDGSFFTPESNGNFLFAQEFASVIGKRNHKEELVKFLKLIDETTDTARLQIQKSILTGLKSGASDLDKPGKLDKKVEVELGKIEKNGGEDIKNAVHDYKSLFNK